MLSKVKNGMIGAALALAAGNAVADDHDHSHKDQASQNVQSEFQFPIGEGARKRFIPVDCDLLDQGKITPDFIKAMGIWGHLDQLENRMLGANDEQKIQVFKKHLNAHGLSDDKIDKAAQYCLDHYL